MGGATADGSRGEQFGAEQYERSEERTTQRNGYREREWDTRVGTIKLAMPKLRSGSYCPGWLEPRRRSEHALVAVVAQAYVQGVSTRKVYALVQSLGINGMREQFRTRRLDADYPYLWLDAAHVREGGRVVSMAVVVAYGVRADGIREVLGRTIGLSEDVVLWREFLQSLVARGLRGVQLVISDAHVGLKQAIREVFLGVSRQRCRVHFMRNLLARVPKTQQSQVAATVRTLFEQPDRAAAYAQLQVVCETLARFPALLTAAEEEIFSFYSFPEEHRRHIASTNPLERLNKELKRRRRVIGIFPNRESVLRLFGALLAEQNDDWLVSGRRSMSEPSLHKAMAPAKEVIDVHVASRYQEQTRWSFTPLDGTLSAGPRPGTRWKTRMRFFKAAGWRTLVVIWAPGQEEPLEVDGPPRWAVIRHYRCRFWIFRTDKRKGWHGESSPRRTAAPTLAPRYGVGYPLGLGAQESPALLADLTHRYGALIPARVSLFTHGLRQLRCWLDPRTLRLVS